ncbi:MAG: YbjQ family protein [Dehalococcoidales bacterium]|nr:YbjQ family protein [Dehalococcoidales bacterium]MDX9986112.1 YbjQ family protein [Dehalococcoidales bacterium]
MKSKEEKGEEKPKWLTTEFIPGKTIASSVGIVRGSAIRAKHLGKDIIAGLRGIVGGEITEYTEMMADAREEALKRMIEDATLIGANAIIGLRFGTAMVMQNAAEVLAYGTGVVLE